MSIYDRARAMERVAPSQPDKITSLEDVQNVIFARHQTAIAAELAAKQKRLADEHNAPTPAESRSGYEYLTTDEILTLDRLERQKALQKAEFEKQFVSFGQWIMN